MTNREWVAASLGSSAMSVVMCAMLNQAGCGLVALTCVVANLVWLLSTATPRT